MVAPRAISAIVALVLGLAVGYGIALTVEGTGSATTSASEDGSVNWLFVITASSGTFSDNGSGDLTLTFTDVKERVVMFSDRPARVTGDMPLEQFAALWNEDGPFAEDPPNADLEFLTGGGDQRGKTLELTDVILNGGLTFSARALKGAGFVEEASTTTGFTDATLFIDSAMVVGFGGEPGPSGGCARETDPQDCTAGYMSGFEAGFDGTTPTAKASCFQEADIEACVIGYNAGYGDGQQAAAGAPIPNT